MCSRERSTSKVSVVVGFVEWPRGNGRDSLWCGDHRSRPWTNQTRTNKTKTYGSVTFRKRSIYVYISRLLVDSSRGYIYRDAPVRAFRFSGPRNVTDYIDRYTYVRRWYSITAAFRDFAKCSPAGVWPEGNSENNGITVIEYSVRIRWRRKLSRSALVVRTPNEFSFRLKSERVENDRSRSSVRSHTAGYRRYLSARTDKNARAYREMAERCP